MRLIPSGSRIVTSIINAPQGLVGTIGYRIRERTSGDVVVPRTTVGIEEDPPASGYYIATTPPLILPLGDYEALWDTDPGGVVTPTNSMAQAFRIVAATSVVVDPAPDPLGASSLCSFWISASDVKTAVPSASDEEASDAAQLASEILYELSGQQYPGLCEATVAPWPTGWCYMGEGWHGIMLPHSRIASIVDVTFDGEPVDPIEYWLEGHIIYGLAPTSLLEITYRYGQAPPLAGRKAALAFAAELAKPADKCALPENVEQINRRGVTYKRRLQADIAASRKVGIGLVDLFLSTYNPSGASGMPSVWSPDVHNPRRVIT